MVKRTISTLKMAPPIDLVQQASWLAKLCASEEKDPLLAEQALAAGKEIAELLSHLQVDEETIAAGWMYPLWHQTLLNREDIQEQFGADLAKLLHAVEHLDGLQQLWQASSPQKSLPQQENLRKMLLTMVDDVRAVLIKLAERTCLLRRAKNFPLTEQRLLAQETLALYAPLANRLGISEIKWELEDLSFRYLEPECYKSIASGLARTRTDREQDVQYMLNALQDALKEAGVTVQEITGRAKHIYSIHRKMQRKKISYHDIYDVIALRVLTANIEACYAALSVVHAKWVPIQKEFDDYIATPKSNGYRSIHTAVVGIHERPVEIQIRTEEMHRECELGVAAHWRYKEGGNFSSSYEEKIAWLRHVLAWQNEITGDESRASVRAAFADRIYVFTPQGDLLDMPQGSTPLDFAYYVHSDIGHRCKGAKVNGHIVPLTSVLQTGDRIEILTGRVQAPRRDWLNAQLGYVHTSRARAKIHHWFRQEELSKASTSAPEEIDADKKSLSEKPIRSNKPIRQKNILNDILIPGMEQVVQHTAKCCKPLPQEPIVGFVTQGFGVSVHRARCRQAELAAAKDQEGRWVNAQWQANTRGLYPIDLVIQSSDRTGLLRDLSTIFANDRINLLAMRSRVNRRTQEATIHVTATFSDTLQLSRMREKLLQLPGILGVKRGR